MKSKEKALAEWVSDEIRFDDSHLSGKTAFNRAEFAVCCAKMRGTKEGATVPVLQDAATYLVSAMNLAGWSGPQITAWLDQFFTPENLVRFTDPYTIKSALARKTKNLKAAANGLLFNVMR